LGPFPYHEAGRLAFGFNPSAALRHKVLATLGVLYKVCGIRDVFFYHCFDDQDASMYPQIDSYVASFHNFFLMFFPVFLTIFHSFAGCFSPVHAFVADRRGLSLPNESNMEDNGSGSFLLLFNPVAASNVYICIPPLFPSLIRIRLYRNNFSTAGFSRTMRFLYVYANYLFLLLLLHVRLLCFLHVVV